MSCTLYCHCAHAQVVPAATKNAVLAALSAAGVAFEAVGDLCEMSARKDAALARLAAQPGLRIVACHRRAVSWLMHAAGTALPGQVPVLNMREQPAEAIIAALAGSAPAAAAPADAAPADAIHGERP
jgi:hypothetical protein